MKINFLSKLFIISFVILFNSAVMAESFEFVVDRVLYYRFPKAIPVGIKESLNITTDGGEEFYVLAQQSVSVYPSPNSLIGLGYTDTNGKFNNVLVIPGIISGIAPMEDVIDFHKQMQSAKDNYLNEYVLVDTDKISYQIIHR